MTELNLYKHSCSECSMSACVHMSRLAGRFRHSNCSTHQLLFHVCRTWGSWMLCLSACSSRKSNMYLMASGRTLPRWAVLKMVSNRSSTNFCNVPYRRERESGEISARSPEQSFFITNNNDDSHKLPDVDQTGEWGHHCWIHFVTYRCLTLKHNCVYFMCEFMCIYSNSNTYVLMWLLS